MPAALTALLTAGLAASVLAGCAPADDERPLVVVSTNILGDVVDRLVGDDVEVMTLMRPDADPHSFEISAQDAARLRTADLLVSNGLGLEEGLQQHIDAAVAEGVDSFVAGEAIAVLEYASGDAAGTPDPHF
ncbi:ABC-type Zn uptake system ZnuABC Zn-binding protein ZnuA [Microbacterium trichothecenolyticum]|nr:ABC-type Zn uptake system ZnuABC Zn-binding protein ZnuA [Microbacterium trichothecenolyticum]